MPMTKQERIDGFMTGYKELVHKFGLVADGCESCKIIYLVPHVKYDFLHVERHFIDMEAGHAGHVLTQLWDDLDAADKANTDECPVPQEEDYQI